jgi:putative membrane protein
MNGMYHFWGMGAGWMIGVAFLVAFIWLIVKVSNHDRGYSGQGYSGNTGRSAIDILNERYARGEISKEEFEEKKRGIQS